MSSDRVWTLCKNETNLKPYCDHVNTNVCIKALILTIQTGTYGIYYVLKLPLYTQIRHQRLTLDFQRFLCMAENIYQDVPTRANIPSTFGDLLDVCPAFLSERRFPC